MLRNYFSLLMGLACVCTSYAQITNTEYKKALWMTTRMYGGQRSGHGPNWLIMDHNVSNNGKTRNGVDFINDSDGSVNLSGGWHDCGDHPKFGQTQYYAAYVLLLGYDAFPTGYDDYYSADYVGYHTAQDFSWAGGQGTPNGIPDILDEVKYATDYFIKCARDNNTFYSQVGNGNFDHQQWVTSVHMSTLSVNQGGENRAVKKNPNDASMASFCGASLALMSRHYRKFDPAYADLCLQHAQYAYAYAASKKSNNGGTISGNYYGQDNNWRDNYVCLCAEMYWATGDDSYKTEALTYLTADNNYVQNQWWVMDFENSQDLAIYNLTRLGNNIAQNRFNAMASYYKDKENGNGLIEAGGSWGRLRYCANAAFIVALNQKYFQEANINSGVQGTADFILGDNSANQSFVVGYTFGSNTKSPKEPHHRNVYLSDANDMDIVSIPARNEEFGFMVGGTSNPGAYNDDVHNYQQTEGCIDYQAGFVGVLGFVNSIKDPVDTTKFTVGIKDFSAFDNYFSVSPNPTTDYINFQHEDLGVKLESISVVSVQGVEVMHISNAKGSMQLETSSWEPGTYFVKVTSSKGEVFTKKIQKL